MSDSWTSRLMGWFLGCGRRRSGLLKEIKIVYMTIKRKFIWNIRKYFKKIKNYFYIFKYFYVEAKVLVLVMLIAIAVIFIYIFTNDLPEIIPFGSELIIVAYNISIAFLIGAILYFLQIFLPKIVKRKNAQRELNIIINGLTKLISTIIENYYSDQKLWEVNFANSPSKYIYSDIDKISKYIADNLKLNDILRFKWNEKKKRTLIDEFFESVKKFNENYREIRLKYGDYLENKTLDNLERIYRNLIFIRIREYNYLSQYDIHQIEIKKLLQNMRNIQETADKINNICR